MTTTTPQLNLTRRYNHAIKLLQQAATLLTEVRQDGDYYLVDATMHRAAAIACRSLVLTTRAYLLSKNSQDGQEWANVESYRYRLSQSDAQLGRMFGSAYDLLRLISRYKHHMSAQVVQIAFDQANAFANCMVMP